MSESRIWRKLFWVAVFGASFALVEASVVVYLRALYYPEGFNLPLKFMPARHYALEVTREAATIVMLVAVAALAGRGTWRRLGFFMVGFGVWDILFYAWLKVVLGWPAGILDWDVLFLIPVPWIGPVIAPVLISLLLIGGGAFIVLRTEGGLPFHPGIFSWLSALVGIGILITSFVTDTAATLHGEPPLPYRYGLLVAGLVLCVISWGLAYTRNRSR